jgi:chromosome segregation ATPase
MLAEASLSLSLERIQKLLGAHEVSLAAEVARVEDAIAALADPEAVAEEIATARAETARQVAEASEVAARANQARTVAEAAARQAAQERADAEDAANAAWELVEALETEAAQLRADLDASEVAMAESKAAQAQAEVVAEGLRAELGELRATHGDELRRLAADHDAALAAARREAAERLRAQHGAELEKVRARAEVAVARAEARAEGAIELAAARAGEVERLVVQVHDLRAGVGRGNEPLSPA